MITDDIIDRLKAESVDYDLVGVEFTTEDADTVRKFVKDGESFDRAISLTLVGIADCLAEGYED